MVYSVNALKSNILLGQLANYNLMKSFLIISKTIPARTVPVERLLSGVIEVYMNVCILRNY